MGNKAKDAKPLWLNTDVLFEEWFSVAEIHRNQHAWDLFGNCDYETVRRICRYGRKSPATKKLVKLEVAFGASGQMCSSTQACRRFFERLNGFLDVPDQFQE